MWHSSDHQMAVGIHVDSALPSLCRFRLFKISHTRLAFAKGISSQADSVSYKGDLISYDCGAAGCAREPFFAWAVRNMYGQARCDKDCACTRYLDVMVHDAFPTAPPKKKLRLLSPAFPDLVLPALKPVSLNRPGE